MFARKQTYVTFCMPGVAAIEREFTPATSHGFSGVVILPPYYATWEPTYKLYTIHDKQQNSLEMNKHNSHHNLHNHSLTEHATLCRLNRNLRNTWPTKGL